MTRAWATGVLAAAIAMAASAIAAGVIPASVILVAQAPTFRSRVSVVRVDVLATDRGKPIPNLTADDFEVLDNGVEQTVSAIFGENQPLDLLRDFDRSGSMQGETLLRLEEAAHSVLEQLGPDDRAAVLTFSESLALHEAFTTDRTALHKAIDSIEAKGATALLDSLYAALTLAEHSDRRTLVLLFTDGLDNQSWLPEAGVLNVARESEAVLYAVTFNRPERDVLDELADATGGRVVPAGSDERLKRVFLEVLSEMRARYLLTYTPRGVDTPGVHTLSVRLKRRAGRIDARQSYFVRSVD